MCAFTSWYLVVGCLTAVYVMAFIKSHGDIELFFLGERVTLMRLMLTFVLIMLLWPIIVTR